MKFTQMRVTVLGSGTSTGVPLIGCSCRVCKSKEPKNKRLRASVWIEFLNQNKTVQSWIIDVSPDFRVQAIRSKIPRLDAILFTHPHADHTGGVDDLRAYNFLQNERLQAYVSDWTLEDLPGRYPYIFKNIKAEGGGVSKIDLNLFNSHATSFVVNGISVIPLPVPHGSKENVGIRIGNFAYLTDCHDIPDETINRMKGLKILLLDCIRFEEHDTHLNYEKALHFAKRIGAKQTVFTHLGHDFDYKSFSKKLPKGMSLAYDLMSFQIKK